MTSLIKPDVLQRYRSFSLAIILFLFGLVGTTCCADSTSAYKSIEELIKKEKGTISVSVRALDSGDEVIALGSKEARKPASIQKIATSLAALEILGPEFQYRTPFFYDSKTRDLSIIGKGDPSITLEQGWLIARELRLRGVRSVHSLVLDGTRFGDLPKPTGPRAYEAAPQALSFNFNSVSFFICPGPLGKAAEVTADPWEAAIKVIGEIKTNKGEDNPTIEPVESGTSSFTYRLGGGIPIGVPCRRMYRSIDDPLRYFAKVFQEFLRQTGITVNGEVVLRRINEDQSPIYVHLSKPLPLILQDLNQFSNNFIAEQILYTLGSDQEGGFSREVGLTRLGNFLEKMGINREQFSLEDGSGLSHANRMSASGVTLLLAKADKSDAISVEFEGSLSVSERSGTLKKRSFSIGGYPLRGKTGSLDGVSSLAGYFKGKSGRRFAFSIIHNDATSRDESLLVEEKIVETLYNSSL